MESSSIAGDSRLLACLALVAFAATGSGRLFTLGAIGLLMGIVLYHAAFGLD